MHRLRQWLFLHGWLIANAYTLLVYCWLLFFFSDVEWLRGCHWHVPHHGLWRGQRVCGRICAAGHLHMQPRLCFDIHDDDRVCRQHWQLPCLWFRPQLRWQWRPGSGVFMLSWVRIDLDDVKRVCWQHQHMLDGRL